MSDTPEFVEVEIIEDDDNNKQGAMSRRKKFEIKKLVMSTYSVLVVIAYVAMVFFLEKWHPHWVIFLTIPVVASVVDAILERKFALFSVDALVVATFVIVGATTGKWHPAWMILLLVPLWRYILNTIKRIKRIKQMD